MASLENKDIVPTLKSRDCYCCLKFDCAIYRGLTVFDDSFDARDGSVESK